MVLQARRLSAHVMLWLRLLSFVLLLAMGVAACAQSTSSSATARKTAPTPISTWEVLSPTVVPFPTVSSPVPTPTSAPTPKATSALPKTPTPSPTTTPPVTPVGQSGSWRLIFHDEFDGTSLNASKWTTCSFNFTVGNDCDHDQNEQELYQPTNVSVHNGVLTLTAHAQTVHAVNGKTYQ